MAYGIVVHGGAGGTSIVREEECHLAAQVGRRILDQEGSSLDAAVAAVQYMEDSGVFNAGVGSVKRLDGRVQMDAVVAIADDLMRTAEFVSGIQNPVLLARELLDSSMRRIGGMAATQFALERGLLPHPGSPAHVVERWRKLSKDVVEALARGEVPEGWEQAELERLLESDAHDTVGAIALDQSGVLALASSTGGAGIMHPARGGDVPVRGAGFQIGGNVAVLATGIGEAILDLQGAQFVFELIARERFSPQEACEYGVRLFRVDVGFIALTTKGTVGIGSNCEMPSHALVEIV